MTTLVLSFFLMDLLFFLQIKITIIKAWTSMNFGEIPIPTLELAALERLKNQ